MKDSNPLHRIRVTRRGILRLAATAVAATALDGLAVSSSIVLEHKHLKLPHWDVPNFRVALLTDVHLNNEALRDRAREAFSMAMDLKPDLLVFTGDFLNKATDVCLGYVQDVFSMLGDASCPCFAVPGNHDYTCRATELLFSTVKKLPIQLLRNEIVDVQGVSLLGLDDAYSGHANFDLPSAAKLSRSSIALLHEPDFVNELQGSPSLVLSGHSHGGEICLPGGIPLHTPAGAKRYTRGYYPNAKLPLYVSRGVATLGPFRMFCPPEVTLLTLTSA